MSAMRTRRKSGNTWLARVLRGLRLDRNPLRRGSDRAETAVLGVLLAAFLAGAPFAAHAAGSWTYTTSSREAQSQQASLHLVPATLLQTALPWNVGEPGAEANARWQAPDGQVRTGLSEALAVACLAIALIAVGSAVRRALDRRRLHAWDVEWLATGPRWSSRR